MTESKRIILNTLASYGKSIVTLPLHLLSARWILQGLGADDFGLQGVVGGVVFFITFISAVSSQAVSRFYAFSIGVEKKVNNSTLQPSTFNLQPAPRTSEVCLWFNTAIFVHFLLPFIILTLGYPIGVYAIHHWLVIPPERLSAAIWVFRLSLVTAFFGMLYVPYVALYMAYQLITNLTVFTILTAICTAAFAYCFASLGGDHLIVFAIGSLLISVVIGGIQVAYAHHRFSVARIIPAFLCDLRRIKEMLAFAWWRLLASSGYVLRTQGSAFLANIYFGVTANAALNVANQLSGQTAAFSAHLGNALMPAIVTSTGADQHQHTIDLVFRSCKFGTLLVLLFAIPMILECDYILRLWLGTPPPDSVPLCICMILAFVIDRFTAGHEYALTATGKIAAWQTWETFAHASAILVGWLFIKLGSSVVAIGYAFISTTLLIGLGRLYFARRLSQIAILPLLRRVLLPLLFCAALTLLPLAFMRLYIFDLSLQSSPSTFTSHLHLLSLFLTTFISMSSLLLLAWFFSFDPSERQYLSSRIFRPLLRRMHINDIIPLKK